MRVELKDIEAFAQSLNVCWIKRLYKTDGPWQSICAEMLNVENVYEIFDLDRVSLLKVAKYCQNPFWKEVIKSWVAYMETFELHENEVYVLNLPIWNGYFVCNHNVQVMGKQLSKKGCRRIKDLINKETLHS